MNNFWDERFANSEYIYGEKPNEFFKSEIKKLPVGKLLLPAEGEGRNAVYASLLNWDVTAFDTSIKGIEKAIQLADKHKVSFNYQNLGYTDINFESNSFDAIALVYAHMPIQIRRNIHNKLIDYLKPGGTLILEGFSKDQLKYNSGGPGNMEMLFSENEILGDFKLLSTRKISTQEIELSEGDFHKGKASVVRYVGYK